MLINFGMNLLKDETKNFCSELGSLNMCFIEARHFVTKKKKQKQCLHEIGPGNSCLCTPIIIEMIFQSLYLFITTCIICICHSGRNSVLIYKRPERTKGCICSSTNCGVFRLDVTFLFHSYQMPVVTVVLHHIRKYVHLCICKKTFFRELNGQNMHL